MGTEVKVKNVAILLALIGVMAFVSGWFMGFWFEPLNLDNAEDFCWRMGSNFVSWNTKEIVCKAPLDNGRIESLVYRNPDMKIIGHTISLPAQATEAG